MLINKFKSTTSLLAILVSLSLTISPYASAVELVISGNGSESNNTITAQVETEVQVVQENNASVENNVDIDSNTGENTASDNSGNVSIQTGDTNNDIGIENELNTSQVEVECCGDDQTLEISGNGESSNSSINSQIGINTTIVSTQNADIKNNINGTTNTGNNSANGNDGDVSIKTGDINVEGDVKNVANLSFISATVGNGNKLSAKIANILGNSVNNISVKLISDTEVITDYTADISNDINWDLNTGGNIANSNLGDVSFTTGDIFFDFAVFNDPINVGGVDIDCCGTFDDGDNDGGGDEDDGDGGGNGGQNGGSSDNGGGSSSDGGGGSGTLLSAAASTELLGLSYTSSSQQKNRAFWIGFILISIGVKLLGDALAGYNTLQLNEADQKTS